MANPTIAVVGAGIIGCLIAREVISRAPDTPVVVFERDGIGSGTSRRSAGLHFPRGATERVRKMTAYSQDYYERLVAKHPLLPIYSLDMTVVATHTAARIGEVYLDRAALTPADTVPGRMIRVPREARIWRGAGCHYADVSTVAQAMARELRPRVTFREGMRVTAISDAGEEVILRLSTGETCTAGRVVLAPGPWLGDRAWCELVAPMGARVKKVAAIHIEREPRPDEGVVVFQDEDAFLLPLRHRGHWLFSYTCQEWDVDPDAVSDGLDEGVLGAALPLLHRYAPALVEHVAGGRVFCDAYSLDREPQVRALDPAGRVIFAGAANGSGYRLAPAIAAEAVGLLRVEGQTRQSSKEMSPT
ncbi:NAD(P)/FAD-dependent oxidoreductase [Nocardia pseudobrasiliensis]|uniref:Glycine/D-amino acid oxidase-like deaminating enzyme n=1 Tax=Nocardia pseudobrasiliensis TaxID=45979 RepID=A0A370ID46_9NOCA|nr:FAD-dependent oxidoreductase [Nocardia pseudobrasiliensis]RDI68633.1 glycine/D-amino acid oxidase-like deaminating enzyme [Nocardia pseudobrasiliensis]